MNFSSHAILTWKPPRKWSLPGFNLCSFYFLFLADPSANLRVLRPFFLAKDEPAVAQRANNNNNDNGHFYGTWSLARSRAQCAVQKAADKCINTYNGQNRKGFGPYDRQPRKNLHTAISGNKPKLSVTKHDDNTMMDERSLESCVWVRFPDGFPHEAWTAVGLRQPQRCRGSNPRRPDHKSGALVEWCFTSTETVGLLGTGAQDGHLHFHTAPDLCRRFWFIVALRPGNRMLIRDGNPGRPPRLSHSSWALSGVLPLS